MSLNAGITAGIYPERDVGYCPVAIPHILATRLQTGQDFRIHRPLPQQEIHFWQDMSHSMQDHRYDVCVQEFRQIERSLVETMDPEIRGACTLGKDTDRVTPLIQRTEVIKMCL